MDVSLGIIDVTGPMNLGRKVPVLYTPIVKNEVGLHEPHMEKFGMFANPTKAILSDFNFDIMKKYISDMTSPSLKLEFKNIGLNDKHINVMLSSESLRIESLSSYYPQMSGNCVQSVSDYAGRSGIALAHIKIFMNRNS